MNHNGAVIHQHPAHGFPTFNPVGFGPSSFSQRFLDRVDNGPNLAVRAARGNDKPVGDCYDLSNEEGFGILSELVVGGVGGDADPVGEFVVRNCADVDLGLIIAW